MSEQSRFSVKRAAGGVGLGLVIGAIATFSGEPPWWWLAVPLAGIGAGFSSGDNSGSSDSSSSWSGGGGSDTSSGGGDGGGGEATGGRGRKSWSSRGVSARRGRAMLIGARVSAAWESRNHNWRAEKPFDERGPATQ